MDLNYLFHRHQISLMKADAATCCSSRFSHREMAAGYAERIRSLQQSFGTCFTPLQAA